MEGKGGVNDFGKRRKLKSSSLNNHPSGYYSYINENLDQWLDNCLKDASQLEFSSSSEFLDHNPESNVLPNFANQKKNQPKLQKPKNNSHLNAINFISHQPQYTQNDQQQHPHPHEQAHFANMNDMFTDRNGQRNNYNTFVQSSQKGSILDNIIGSYAQSGVHGDDFTSIPSLINMLGRRSNEDTAYYSTEYDASPNVTLNACSNRRNMTRRFSDSCLLNASKKAVNTDEYSNNLLSDRENMTRIFTTLMEQIQLMHATNAKINRNLYETKVDIEAFKHAHTWRLKQRRDSISGLSTYSQPQMIFGNRINAQSPASTCQSSTYAPGVMADIVREVKEATRLREDALINRVKAMVEERQWSLNNLHLRLTHDIQELKSHVHRLRMDRKVTNKRITNLEAENQCMRRLLASIRLNPSTNGGICENEMSDSHKSFIHSHTTPVANLSYSAMYQQSSPSSLEELEEQRHTTTIPFDSVSNNICCLSVPSSSKKDVDIQEELHSRKKNFIPKVATAKNGYINENMVRNTSLELKSKQQSAYTTNQEYNDSIISWV